MLMSEPEVTIDAVAELLPPAVVPPLVSLVAPVLMATDDVPVAVGVPLTEQLMLPPGGTLAGGVGEQPVTVTPGGRPNPTASPYAANLSGATGRAQHEQRGRPTARPTISSRRKVAIESET